MNTDTPSTPTPPTPSPSPECEPEKTGTRFSLLNVLSAVAIVGVLAAMIIPMIGPVRGHSPRYVDSSNLRQIGQASLIYASDHKDQLPQVDDIHAFAFALAKEGGLNDASIWVSSQDRRDSQDHDGLSTVLAPDGTALHPVFAAIRPSVSAVVRGLHVAHPSTTPIAWTRGLRPDGTWSKDSPYDGDGGYIVFLGGNVAFYRDLKRDPLTRFDGQGTTTDIRQALPPDAVIGN